MSVRPIGNGRGRDVTSLLHRLAAGIAGPMLPEVTLWSLSHSETQGGNGWVYEQEATLYSAHRGATLSYLILIVARIVEQRLGGYAVRIQFVPPSALHHRLAVPSLPRAREAFNA